MSNVRRIRRDSSRQEVGYIQPASAAEVGDLAPGYSVWSPACGGWQVIEHIEELPKSRRLHFTSGQSVVLRRKLLVNFA